MTAHWGIPDPAEAKGSPAQIALAFKDAYRMLFQRIGVFTALPIRSLDQLSLQQRLKEIGRSRQTPRPDGGVGQLLRAEGDRRYFDCGSASRLRLFAIKAPNTT
jgi:hypothetical protein